MEKIKNDIINAISKYMEIDTDALDIQITQTESEGDNGKVPALYANIPIINLIHDIVFYGKDPNEIKSFLRFSARLNSLAI